MTTNEDTTKQKNSASQKSTKRLSRRRMLLTGGVGIAGMATAIAIRLTNRVREMAWFVMFLTSDAACAFHGSIVDVTSEMLD